MGIRQLLGTFANLLFKMLIEKLQMFYKGLILNDTDDVTADN
ncbi:hypothetical protein ACJROX_09890 [Pseudalkalibacillus sp. A8]